MTAQPPATPTAGAYAPVNGLNLYYELHGDPAAGRPLVLLHGGVLSIDLGFGPVLASLAQLHRVIAVDLQGHGRTADPGRPMSLPAFADDVAGLLDHLGVARADLFGASLGAFVALELALTRPERVGRAVLASIPYRPDGYLPEVAPATFRPDSDRMPTAADFAGWKAEYERIAPDPGAFADLVTHASAMVGALTGWSAEQLGQVRCPTLLLIGDHDFVGIPHAAEMLELIPDAQLAVLPGSSHMDVCMARRPAQILATILPFLAEDPATDTPA
jgi:pimeloyl-ACP methyl ester carboxylesterase